MKNPRDPWKRECLAVGVDVLMHLVLPIYQYVVAGGVVRKKC